MDLAGEDDTTFLQRRAAEERRRMTETSCMVRSVHEELVETYEERLEQAEAKTAALNALAETIDKD